MLNNVCGKPPSAVPTGVRDPFSVGRHRLATAATATLMLAAGLWVTLPGGVAQAAAPGIGTLVLRSGEMPGFEVQGSPDVATSASRWVSVVEGEKGAQARRDIQVLRSLGFVDGAYVSLKNANPGRIGGSSALRFKTAADAARYKRTLFAQGIALQPRGTTRHPLRVGVAGALGFTTPGVGSRPAATSDTYFSSGRCLFEIGVLMNGRHPNTAAPVAVAARAIDQRTSSACR
jgi:hypothetical protein